MEPVPEKKKMSMPKIDFSAITRKLFSHNPHRDWAFLVLVFALFVVGIALWQFQLFSQIEKGEAFATQKGAVVTAGGINRQELTKVVDQINEKKRLFEFLKKTSPSAIDPSL